MILWLRRIVFIPFFFELLTIIVEKLRGFRITIRDRLISLTRDLAIFIAYLFASISNFLLFPLYSPSVQVFSIASHSNSPSACKDLSQLLMCIICGIIEPCAIALHARLSHCFKSGGELSRPPTGARTAVAKTLRNALDHFSSRIITTIVTTLAIEMLLIILIIVVRQRRRQPEHDCDCAAPAHYCRPLLLIMARYSGTRTARYSETGGDRQRRGIFPETGRAVANMRPAMR